MVEIRSIRSEDYETLQQLEASIFGKAGYPVVGSYYLRVCTELYAENCFLAIVEGRPIGYILTFMNAGVAYCTRVGVVDEHQGSKAGIQLIAATIDILVKKNYELVWFTVKPNNAHARKLYLDIGAIERGTRQDFFAPGDELIFMEMNKAALHQFHQRFEMARGTRV